MANTVESPIDHKPDRTRRIYLGVFLFAAAIYLGCAVSPPSLMDDVDAVQAQIARNMVHSGDWVTARLDGVAYLEKSPLIYWMIAACYKVFGASDVVARMPVVFSAIGLALLTAAFGVWAFGRLAGFYAGLVISTCVGLFLFTRIQIPDVMLTATGALAIWAILRALEDEEPRPRLWAFVLAACLGTGLLLKSLVGMLFPIGAGLVYLVITKQLLLKRTWQRLRPLSGIAIILIIAVPWHILAAIRNPPFWEFTMRSAPGEYHGFLWFYFINEQLLRFLNMRYPRDYDTVPRFYFWAFHLLWLFPWSVYFPATLKLAYEPIDRAGRTRLMALCLAGFVMVFFTFSTTQEYYSMPIYPALALLLGSALATGGQRIMRGTQVLVGIAIVCAIATLGIAAMVWRLPTPGDISTALQQQESGTYTLALDHMKDLTLSSFAYLRLPLVVAGLAFTVGAIGLFKARPLQAALSAAIMMTLFFHAARLALVVFDPYMSSRPIAEALLHGPPGELVVDHHYYSYSSVFFYTDRKALLLNGRYNNLVYGSYAPDAPDAFIDDSHFHDLWLTPKRVYIVADHSRLTPLRQLLGADHIHTVLESGGKLLLSNQPTGS